MISRRRLAVLTGISALAASPLALAGPAAARTPSAASAASSGGGSDHVPVCGPADPGGARCNAVQLLDPAHHWRGSPLGRATGSSSTAPTSGYGPADLQSAYALASAAVANGGGQTVAIVDAYDDPYAERDLGAYRANYMLAPCTTANGCFRKVNQSGGTKYPRGSTSWAQEISLDLDMVSAICPNCHILLVEAGSASYANLGTAVNEAVALGANAVSNSYGGSDSSADTSYDASYYNHPGVAVTASTGDNGYGVEYPAASPDVVAVGGTSLHNAGTAASPNWSQSAWSGAGSGCSAYEARPAWQAPALGTACAARGVADVSAVADPNTGVAVYDSYGEPGWLVFGGTSVASPIVASVYALAGNVGGSMGATTAYPASRAYANASALIDVTTGSNGSCGTVLCNGASGWDGPTGLGTPNGVSPAF